MKIKIIKLRHLQIIEHHQFLGLNSSRRVSNSIILEVVTDLGEIGYGEAYLEFEEIEIKFRMIQEDLTKVFPIISRKHFKNINIIKNFVTQEIYGLVDLPIICAIELALLDAWGKTYKLNVLTELTKNINRTIKYSCSIPFVNIDVFKSKLKEIKQYDFKEISLGIGSDFFENIQKIQLLKKCFGNDLKLRLAINGRWNYYHAIQQIPFLTQLGVTVIEQPFPKGREKDMGTITHKFQNQITNKQLEMMADESITTISSAKYLVRNYICNRFNLKISKNGGIFNTLRIANFGKEANITIQLGITLERTNVLIVGNVILLNLFRGFCTLERDFGAFFLEKDMVENSMIFEKSGFLKLKKIGLKNYGLGVSIDQAFLENYTVSTFFLASQQAKSKATG